MAQSSSRRLTAILDLKDRLTNALKRPLSAMKQMQNQTQQATRSAGMFRDAQGRLRDALGRYVAEGNRVASTTSRMTSGFFSANSAAHSLNRGVMTLTTSTQGLHLSLVGVIAQLSALFGMQKAFDLTIGAAAKFEMNEAVIRAMFQGDEKGAKQFMDMISARAIDSPLYSEKDYYANAKSFLTFTKDTDQLSKMWDLAERLGGLDPAQGLSGAVFALREMFSGDGISMVERFEMKRDDINRIKKLDLSQQIVEFDKLLTKMGFSAKFMDDISDTAMAHWNQITEKTTKSLRQMGERGLDRLKPQLKAFNESLNPEALERFVEAGGQVVSGVVGAFLKLFNLVQKYAPPTIQFFKDLRERLEPLAPLFKVLNRALLAFFALSGIVAIIRGIGIALAVLSGPLGWIALAVGLIYTAWEENWMGIREKTAEFIAWIQPKIESFVSTVKDLYDEYMPQITEAWNNFWSNSEGKVNEYAPLIKSAVSRITTDVQTQFELMSPIVKSLWENLWKDVGKVNEIYISPMTKKIVDDFKAMLPEIQTTFSSIISYFEENAPLMAGTLEKFFAYAMPIFDYYVVSIAVLFKVVFGTLYDIIAGFVENFWNFITTIGSAIGGLAKSMMQVATGDYEGAWETMKKTTEQGVVNIENLKKDFMENGYDIGKNFVQSLSEGIDAYTSQVMDSIERLRAASQKDWRVQPVIPDTVAPAVRRAEAMTPAYEPRGYNKYNFHGIDYVPYDGYKTTLHKGEEVVSRQERQKREQAQRPINIEKLADYFVVREEADIQKIAKALALELYKAGEVM